MFDVLATVIECYCHSASLSVSSVYFEVCLSQRIFQHCVTGSRGIFSSDSNESFSLFAWKLLFPLAANMRLVILDDYDLASEWAAKYIRNKIVGFKPTADRYFTLGLPTGMSLYYHI